MNVAPFRGHPSFRAVAQSASVVCIALAIVWTFVPQMLLSLWHVEGSEAAFLMARRGAAVFLGLGAMLYLARNAERSPARRAIAIGMSVIRGMGVGEHDQPSRPLHVGRLADPRYDDAMAEPPPRPPFIISTADLPEKPSSYRRDLR